MRDQIYLQLLFYFLAQLTTYSKLDSYKKQKRYSHSPQIKTLLFLFYQIFLYDSHLQMDISQKPFYKELSLMPKHPYSDWQVLFWSKPLAIYILEILNNCFKLLIPAIVGSLLVKLQIPAMPKSQTLITFSSVSIMFSSFKSRWIIF